MTSDDVDVLKEAIDRLGDSIERVFGNPHSTGDSGYVDENGYSMTVTLALCQVAVGLEHIAQAIKFAATLKETANVHGL